MKPIYKILLLLFIFQLSGCIEIVEEITFNADGSGSVRYTFNMERFVKNMAEMKNEEIDEEAKKKIGEGLDKLADSFIFYVKQVKGVTKLKAIKDYDNFTVGVSYNFKNVETLNKALTSPMKDKPSYVYVFKDNEITRKDYFEKDSIKEDEKIVEEEDDQFTKNLNAMTDSLMDFTYITIIHTPHKIKEYTLKDAILDEDSTTFTKTVKLVNLIKSDTNMDFTIRY